MKDLICFFTFIYSLKLVLFNDSYLAVWVIGLIVISYVIRYNRLNSRVAKLQKKYNLDIKNYLLKQKEHFSEILTHDLKVPTLAQLRGLELLKNETLGQVNSEQKDLILNIENSCKYILNMISMLQDTYKIESGKNKFYFERFNISNLFAECLNNLSELMTEKNVSVVNFVSEKNLVVEADIESIRSVILNLLTFAIAYSFNNEKILVYISQDKNNIKFLIKISGMYLSPENCLNIFEQYGADCQNYTVIGQKISLYLCKRIIEEHSGIIYAKSGHENPLSLVFKIPRAQERDGIEDYLCSVS